jgi:hypothetical protein
MRLLPILLDPECNNAQTATLKRISKPEKQLAHFENLETEKQRNKFSNSIRGIVASSKPFMASSKTSKCISTYRFKRDHAHCLSCSVRNAILRSGSGIPVAIICAIGVILRGFADAAMDACPVL